MVIKIVTPHQVGERDIFLKQLEYYIERQTVKPDEWIVVDHDTGKAKDLTDRVRIGCERAKGADLILIMENDDWYAPNYIERMASEWEGAGRPDLIGVDSTWYYHVKTSAYHLLQHPGRASLMSTGISGAAIDRIKWPDEQVFLDVPLWGQLNSVTFNAHKPISVGIKHGIGNTGGIGHRENWSKYTPDKGGNKLNELIGSDSVFYSNLFNQMKIIAPIPVHGRLPLLKQTIRRLYNRSGIYKVICIGDDPQAQFIAENEGAQWVRHANKPLGAKWNAGFEAAAKYYPDGIIFLGSSDWISDDYLPIVTELLKEYDVIGKLGCHFLDKAAAYRLVFWAGYGHGVRGNEPIGIGRVLGRNILKKIGYRPFDDRLDASLDWSMWNRINRHHPKIHILPYLTGQLVSISTNRWPNKHQFEEHWNNILPSIKEDADKFVVNYPEIHEV
jgi:hypothetical protein